MTIAAEATEAKNSALITELRRCLAFGLPLQGQYVKDALAMAEDKTLTNTSGWTDIPVNNLNDGRSTAEVTVIT